MTTKAAGDVFEVVAEAVLRCVPQLGAVEVWPSGTVPSSILAELRMPTRDVGVDGVYRDTAGRLVAYQAKFRSHAGEVPYADLATFLATAEAAQGRLVVTNCEGISPLARARPRVVAFRGGHFADLGARWGEMLALIRSEPVSGVRLTPKPHQAEAVAALAAALASGDRAQAVMACGTGKTLLGLWTAERMGAKAILCLEPSLSLVRQTLAAWADHQPWCDAFRFLCVCSDTGVAGDRQDIEDTTVEDEADGAVRVTTSAAEIGAFLDGHSEGRVSVVFSTYQSGRCVMEAVSGRGAFDLGIFDEAHRTAGPDGSEFAVALDDDRIPLRKRAFLTATPRTVRVGKGSSQAVRSMDDEASYGPVAYRLSFREAVARGIICPYKVLVSVITDEDLADLDAPAVTDGGETLEDLASRVALAKAVSAYGIRKAFTFHSRVGHAERFAKGGGGLLEGFDLFAVSGAMGTARRACLLAEFRDAPKAVMSNARCLTEGVDVPAVDLVAFMARKRSEVDVVQAVGRALRISEGKKFGYVLLPIHVRTSVGETVDVAVGRQGYAQIWEVLRALLEHDELMHEIGLKAVEARRGGGPYDVLEGIVEFVGRDAALSSLKAAIEVRIVEEFERLLPKTRKAVSPERVERAALFASARRAVSEWARDALPGTTVKVACAGPYKGTDNVFFKIAPADIEAGAFAVCRVLHRDGWCVPSEDLRRIMPGFPLTRRTGAASWDIRIEERGGSYRMSTNFGKYPSVDMTPYYVRFGSADDGIPEVSGGLLD